MENNGFDPGRGVVQSCRKALGRIGLALAAAMVLTQLISMGLVFWLNKIFSGSVENPWISLSASVLPIYLVGIPLVWLMVRRLPCAYPVEKRKIGFGGTVCFVFGSYALSYILQMTLMFALEAARQLTGMDYLDAMPTLPAGSPWATLLFVCLLGPIMEELFFRRLVLRRLLPYGRLFAIVVSAAGFALFHGNFFQLFLAFGVGLALGYITVRTGSIKHAVFMHIFINTYSSLINFMLEDYPVAATVGSIVIMAASLLGVVLLFCKRKTILYHLRPAPADPLRCLEQVVKSPGAWIYVLVCIGLSVWSILGV